MDTKHSIAKCKKKQSSDKFNIRFDCKDNDSRSSSKTSLYGDMDYGNKTSKNFEKRKTVAELFKRDDHGHGSSSPRANSEGDLLGYDQTSASKPARKSWLSRGSTKSENRSGVAHHHGSKSSFFNRFDLMLSKRGSNGTNSPKTEDELDSYELNIKNQSLEDVLSSKDLLPLFRNFLQSEHSDENLDFWESIQDFKDLASMDKCNEIYDMFLKEGAEKEINVSLEIKKVVEKNLPFPTYRVFEAAEESIFQLMKTDSFQRFKTKLIHNMASGNSSLVGRSRFRSIKTHDS